MAEEPKKPHKALAAVDYTKEIGAELAHSGGDPKDIGAGLFFGLMTGLALYELDPTFAKALVDEMHGEGAVDSPATFWVKINGYAQRLMALAREREQNG